VAGRNYDYSGIKVSTNTIRDVLQDVVGGDPNTVGGLLGDVLGQLTDIMTTMQDLRLSWFGDASSQAQDYVDQLNTACDSLFGTKADPQSGVFPRILAGLAAADGNYAGAEDAVQKMFASFASSPQSTEGADSSVKNVDNSGGQVITAITETF
jgi:hypothetical protein